MQIDEIFIGYVQDFKFLNEEIQDKLSNEPKVGSVYRVMVTKAQRVEDDEHVNLYQIYIGKENNKAGMDTLFLGEALEGTYYDKWQYNIKRITEQNLLEFDLSAQELEKIAHWKETNNKDLTPLLKGYAKGVNISEAELMKEEAKEVSELKDKIEDIASSAMSKVLDFDAKYKQSLAKMEKSMKVIMDRDIDMTFVMSDVLAYLKTTYSDKYEAAGTNIAKEFLLNSDSSHVAMFNAIKYLQRYSTKGFKKSENPVDLYKAIHYILFELIRLRQKNEK